MSGKHTSHTSIIFSQLTTFPPSLADTLQELCSSACTDSDVSTQISPEAVYLSKVITVYQLLQTVSLSWCMCSRLSEWVQVFQPLVYLRECISLQVRSPLQEPCSISVSSQMGLSHTKVKRAHTHHRMCPEQKSTVCRQWLSGCLRLQQMRSHCKWVRFPQCAKTNCGDGCTTRGLYNKSL